MRSGSLFATATRYLAVLLTIGVLGFAGGCSDSVPAQAQSNREAENLRRDKMKEFMAKKAAEKTQKRR